MEDGGDEMDGMSFHDRLEFWGLEVPPNKTVAVTFDEGEEELVHITQARGAGGSRLRSAANARGGCGSIHDLRRRQPRCALPAAAPHERHQRHWAARGCARAPWRFACCAPPLMRMCALAPQAALGEKPAEEAAAVSIVVNGKAAVIGTLRKAKCDQFSVRFCASRRAGVSHARTALTRAACAAAGPGAGRDVLREAHGQVHRVPDGLAPAAHHDERRGGASAR
jgi:hypothetical protein